MKSVLFAIVEICVLLTTKGVGQDQKPATQYRRETFGMLLRQCSDDASDADKAYCLGFITGIAQIHVGDPHATPKPDHCACRTSLVILRSKT